MKKILVLIFIVIIFVACGEAEAYVETIGGSFPFEFAAEDLHGNTVTHVSLGERELFLLYFWTTWCGACVVAMPDMVRLANEFGAKVGFVSLLGDFETGRRVAIQMTEDLNIPFFTMDANYTGFEAFIHFVQSGFVPTTAIIDIYGNMIGEMIVGGGYARLREAIEAAFYSQ